MCVCGILVKIRSSKGGFDIVAISACRSSLPFKVNFVQWNQVSSNPLLTFLTLEKC